MPNPQPLEQSTLEQTRLPEAESKAALESKIDQAQPATDRTNANQVNPGSDNQTLKNELPAKQYDAKSEAGARLEKADKQLRFGELEPNSSYERNGCLYETDNQGRITHVHGNLELEPGVRTHHQTEVGHQGQEGDQGGHLIATRFNGSPEGANLVPQDGNLNQGEWKKMENEWARALENGQEVQVDIKVHYPDKDSVRPDAFAVKYAINGEKHQQFFKNQPGG